MCFKLSNLVFDFVQEPTIGAAFFTQILSLSEATVKFDIWDTAGQERYHSLAPMYYRGAAAAVVVYDISSTVLKNQTSSVITSSLLCFYFREQKLYFRIIISSFTMYSSTNNHRGPHLRTIKSRSFSFI